MASSPHLVYWHSKGGYHKHMCGPFFSTEVDHISRNGDTTCNHEDQHVNQFQWKKKSLLQFLSINSLHALLKKWKCPTILQWAFEHKLIKESKYYHAAFCSCMNWLHSFFSVLSNVKDTDTKGIQYHHKDTIKDRIIYYRSSSSTEGTNFCFKTWNFIYKTIYKKGILV